MKAIHWKPQQRVHVSRISNRLANQSTSRNAGFTTDRPPEKIDGLIKVEVKLDDNDLVLLPVHLLSNL